MKRQSVLLRAGSVLFAGHLIAALLSFGRNVLVARLLGVEEFGIAATFAVVLALVEASTDAGLDKMIVQDAEGERPAFQTTLQAIYVIRGLIAGAALMAVSGPFARYMGVGEIVWAYQVLALSPVIRGFVHFDIYRVQRNMRFSPATLAKVAGPLGAVAAVLALGIWIRDFSLVLWSLLALQASFVLVSHLVAERPYGLGWDQAILRRGIGFGWPLILNGLLMFAILQGDRMIVGGEIGVAVLGWFSAAWLLVSTPGFVLINVVRSALLPMLSAVAADAERSTQAEAATLQAGSASAVALVAGFFVFGPGVLILAFGNRYGEALMVLTPIAMAFAFRLLVAAANNIALARGMTVYVLACGVVRVMFLIPTFHAASGGLGVVSVAWIAAAGEGASALVGLFLIGRDDGASLRRACAALLLCLAVAVVIGAAEILVRPEWVGPPLLATLAYPLTLVAILAVAPELRGLARRTRLGRD